MPVQYYDTETLGADTAGIGKLWKRFKRVARKGLKIVSPLLKIVKGIAPMVPGIGTAVAAGLSSAEALASGKNLRDAALAGALGAIPGGPLAQRAARMGAGAILKGHKGRHIRSLRHGLVHKARRAFDVGAVEGAESLMRRGILPAVVPVVTRRKGDRIGSGQMAQAIRSIRKNPGMTVTQVAQKAGLPRMLVADAMAVSKPRRQGGRLLDSRTQAFIAKHAGHIFRGTGGLDPSGKIWIVQSGDTGEKIAQAVVGAKNRWRELLGPNPEIAKRAASKKYGFAIYPNDKVQLPAGWVAQQAAAAVPAPIAALPAAQSILASLPNVLGGAAPTTWSDIPQPSPTPAAPEAPSATAPDPGVMQSRAELVAWAKTDGNDVAPWQDYGQSTAESGAQWSDRDKLTATVFETLWNKQPGVNQTDGTGAYNEQLAIALDSWAQMKAQNPTVAVTGEPVTPGLLPGILGPAVVTPTTTTVPTPASPIPATPVSLPPVASPGLAVPAQPSAGPPAGPVPTTPPAMLPGGGAVTPAAPGDNSTVLVGLGLAAVAGYFILK